MLGVSCENLARADAIHEKLKELYGVSTLRMGIVREFIPVNDWPRGRIHSKARRDRVLPPAQKR